MCVLVMFDLPVTSSALRKVAVRFRQKLIAKGFEMLQRSIYNRWTKTAEEAKYLIEAVKGFSPEEGNVLIVRMTEDVFLRSVFLHNGNVESFSMPPEAYALF